MASMKLTDDEIACILALRAKNAGWAAVEDFKRRVGENYHGPCGFAWIDIRPANSKFAKWLVARGYAKKCQGRPGVYIWIGQFISSQCVDVKERFAQAFCDVLVAAGIDANSDSRLD